MRRIGRWACGVVLLALVALWLGLRFQSPGQWWLELLRYVPFPAYLGPASAVLAGSCLLGRKWQWAAGLGVALVLVALMDFCWGSADTGIAQVRVMTYNAKAHNARQAEGGFARIAWEIARHDPDVLVMQDADGVVGPDVKTPEPLHAAFGNRTLYASGQYVVASRLPLRDCADGQIPYRGEPHIYVRCTLVVAGRDIDLVTVHFISPREGLNAARHEQFEGLDDWRQNYAGRLVQAALLVSDLRERRRPLIIAGDLNASEGSPVVAPLLRLGLRDAFSSAGFGYGFTYGHDLRPAFSFLRIDHILVGKGLGVVDAFAGGKEGSEHRPVVADITLTE